MYVCMCIYVCMCVCMYVYVYECMDTCMYVCMYVCVHVCTHVCMYVCMCTRMYTCMYVYMYVCTCVHMYICASNQGHSGDDPRMNNLIRSSSLSELRLHKRYIHIHSPDCKIRAKSNDQILRATLTQDVSIRIHSERERERERRCTYLVVATLLQSKLPGVLLLGLLLKIGGSKIKTYRFAVRECFSGTNRGGGFRN